MRVLNPPKRKRKGGTQFQYEFAFMRKVVEDYINGNEVQSELAKRYNINKGLIASWARRYRQGKPPFDVVPLSVMETTQSQLTQEDQHDLQKQNEELRKKLEQANLKITGLEIMIDLAEEQLGVDIRKNSGAKQSENCAITTQEQA